jgi:hypothetical protein
MPSTSFQTWSNTRLRSLDEIEAAHQSVGGGGPGRKYATQQINQAYAVLLSSQFQAFSRDLHSECAEKLVETVPLPDVRTILRTGFIAARKLDSGNANPGNLGADFSRFVMSFWDDVKKRHAQNKARQDLLEDLNAWRNAIAHQEFSSPRCKGRTTIQLSMIRRWRQACEALSADFDEVMRAHLQSVLGASPW